jgi:tartrate/fumarate subfamily iron-sulfur-dependent hydro-lyase beta chain
MSSREFRFRTPLSEGDVKKLRIGDIVYLDGLLFTSRERALIRALDERKGLPVMDTNVMIQTGPLMRRKGDGWDVVGLGVTEGKRFEPWTPAAIENFGLRAVACKGSLSRGTSEVMKKNKCVQFTATTVAAPVQFAFAQCVKEINDVHWLDLGTSDAVWVLEVEKLGPLIVNIDTDGNNLYDERKKEIDKNVKKAYEMLGINNFAYSTT